MINWKGAGSFRHKRWLAAIAGVFCLSSALAAGAAETETAAEAEAKSKAVIETESAAETEAASLVGNSRQANVYIGTLDNSSTLTTWEVEGQEDVPYIALDEYLNLVYSDMGALEYSWDGNVYEIGHNDETITVDLDTQEVYCDNWKAFAGAPRPDMIQGSIFSVEDMIALQPSVKHESTSTSPTGYGVKLKDYNVALIRYEDRVLAPFAVAGSVFAAPYNLNVLAYNGDDYYDIVSQAGNIYGTMAYTDTINPYSDKWYSGSFASRTTLSKAYAKYNYASLCILLDLTYGHKEEKGIVNFDTYLEKAGLKDALMSVKPEAHADALSKVFVQFFDSGHDGEMLSRSIIHSDGTVGQAMAIHALLELAGYASLSQVSEIWTPIMMALARLVNINVMDFISPLDTAADQSASQTQQTDENMPGPNMTALAFNAMRMQVLKPLLYGKNRVDIEGDTAIIYFESFLADMLRGESYYVKLPTINDIDKSTFALLYYAFKKIEEAGGVKNVVFDVSNNGGGYASALISALGFLSDDGEVEFSYLDQLSKSYCTEHFHVDTNLDGSFDDQDGYGGDYNFYIMTSGYSYSCANALPYFAQKQGLAKIIGEKPGGGDCAVNFYLDAYGHVASMSGPNKIGMIENGTFVSDEKAVEVDLPFPVKKAEKIFFHPEEIAKFVRKS